MRFLRDCLIAAILAQHALLPLALMLWVGVLAWKIVWRDPLVYTLYPELAAETKPLAYIFAWLVLLVAVVAKARGPNEHAARDILSHWAPRIFASASAILALWLALGPNRAASLWPLSAVAALALWATFATRWGRLRQRVGAATSIEGPRAAAGEGARVRVANPRVNFASIFGEEGVKARLKAAAVAVTRRRKEGVPARNGILLHGLPGNGKTYFAEALAGELKLPFLQLGHADVASQWVGERTARVREAFAEARRRQPCVFFIDEIDSFLEARDGAPGGIKEDRDLVNALLTLMVDIRLTRVVLVAATNHLDRLDGAAIREGRFDFKIEIPPPDRAARFGLLQQGVRSHLPRSRVSSDVLQSLADRWNGFSSKRILAVVEELSQTEAAAKGRADLGFDDFMGALRRLQGQHGVALENVTALEDLVLSDSTREALGQLLGRLLDPQHTERHGGTLPTGVLFWGPPGTGKTAACKAVARASGWALLTSTGADLAGDSKALEGLYRKAMDLRPALIFIDEADELLFNREHSSHAPSTNKLLTLMDGVSDRVRDVVWIAATNHPERIDPALLRGGRFSEKVPFELPTQDQLRVFLEHWFSSRNVLLQPDVSAAAVAHLLGEESIANAQAVVQTALNRAISRREGQIRLSMRDITYALETVQS